MLNVASKPFVLSVVMLTVVMLTVVMLSVVMLSVIMLSVVEPKRHVDQLTFDQMAWSLLNQLKIWPNVFRPKCLLAKCLTA